MLSPFPTEPSQPGLILAAGFHLTPNTRTPKLSRKAPQTLPPPCALSRADVFSVPSSSAHLALCFRAVIFLAVRGEDMLRSSLALQRGSCERRDMFIFPAPTRTSNALWVSASQRGRSVPLAAPRGAPEPLQAACFTLRPPPRCPCLQIPNSAPRHEQQRCGRRGVHLEKLEVLHDPNFQLSFRF